MTVRILRGDVRDRLRDLPDESVHCIVTSPPYFGLRDYGHDGQIGLEDSPQEYIDELVVVFREARRVLRSDGTLWLNLGDSYAGSWGAQSRPQGATGEMANRSVISARQIRAHPRFEGKTGTIGKEWGLKPKDLMGMPWRVALALQADGNPDTRAMSAILLAVERITDAYEGLIPPDKVIAVLERLYIEYGQAKGESWWLRQDIIWAKPNPMPESIKDRCTKAHEYIFLLSKSERYYFDHEAIMEPAEKAGRVVHSYNTGAKDRQDVTDANDRRTRIGLANWNEEVPENRFCRSVWTITTKGYPDAHFATFPPDLPERCIKAGAPVGGDVLDTFAGACTTGLVADRLQRNAILIEINPEYADMGERRIRGDAPLFAQVGD